MANIASYSLRQYANDELHLDDYWFIESAAEIPATLPLPESPISGASIVPWRYNLNTGKRSRPRHLSNLINPFYSYILILLSLVYLG